MPERHIRWLRMRERARAISGPSLQSNNNVHPCIQTTCTTHFSLGSSCSISTRWIHTTYIPALNKWCIKQVVVRATAPLLKVRTSPVLSTKAFSRWVTRGRFVGLTSKIPSLGSMVNFDADVKKTTAHHQRDNRLHEAVGKRIAIGYVFVFSPPKPTQLFFTGNQ